MKLSEKLHRRLTEDLGLGCHTPERLPRSRAGKEAGAWAWCAKKTNGFVGEIVSEDTMLECLKADELKTHNSIYDRSVTVVSACQSK